MATVAHICMHAKQLERNEVSSEKQFDFWSIFLAYFVPELGKFKSMFP